MTTSASLGRKSTKTSRLDSIPPELIVYITDFLSSSCTICLSLTCSTLYQLIRRRCKIGLSTYLERLNLLNCLSRDLPQYLPCYGRVKPRLYLWHDQRNRFYHCDHCLSNANHRVKYQRNGSKIDGTSGIPMYAMCGDPRHEDNMDSDCVTFGLRTLVLRHELLGPEYGVPMSVLFCKCSHSSHTDKATLKITAVPKIVKGGNLMIHKTVVYRSRSRELPQNLPQIIVCPHVQPEAFDLMRFGRARVEYSEGELEMMIIAFRHHDPQNISEEQALHRIRDAGFICAYPSDKWLRYLKLMKCEYCATDARFFVRRTTDSSNVACYEYRFEVYHDFGNLYQPMTTPQRQLIEVATNLPKVQTKYPSTLEFHERICHDLERKYYEPVPLNIRGTAMDAMRWMTYERRKAILKVQLPSQVCLFSHRTRARTGFGSQRSSGFENMVGQCGESVPCSCPAEIWYVQQEGCGMADFGPDPRDSR